MPLCEPLRAVPAAQSWWRDLESAHSAQVLEEAAFPATQSAKPAKNGERCQAVCELLIQHSPTPHELLSRPNCETQFSCLSFACLLFHNKLWKSHRVTGVEKPGLCHRWGREERAQRGVGGAIQ